MCSAILSTDANVTDQSSDESIPFQDSESEGVLPELILPVKQSFGIVDLWKIRSLKRHFSIYRNRL